jgi:hypothetical protein
VGRNFMALALRWKGDQPLERNPHMKKLAPFMILVIIAAAAYALINRDSSDAV